MMSDTTPRLALPLLAAGQAQKEVLHNEALTTLDGMVQAVAQTAGVNDPPGAPGEGQSWIVGAAPTGLWSGHAHNVAVWSGGGWRFVPPFEGLELWLADAALPARWSAGAWQIGTIAAAALRIGGDQVVGARQPAIAAAAGGSVVDDAARGTISAILAALRNHGLIAS
jgi:hypothetical protein